MGIKEESVNFNFEWGRSSKTAKVFLIACIVFAFSIIRFSFNTEYVGYFAGECYGECKTNYTITSDEVIVEHSSNDGTRSIHKVLKGDFNNLKFNAPLLLLSNFTGSFGCPDCDDGGGYVLGFKFFWMRFNFAFDRNSSPWYFSGAVDTIQDRLRKIEQIEASQSNP